MDLNFKWAKKEERGRGIGTNEFVSIAVNRNGKYKDGSTRWSVVVSFSEEARKEFRLMESDKIEVGFDRTAKLIALKRTKENSGFSLSKTNSNSVALRFSFHEASYPFVRHETIYLKKDNYFEQDGMIVFNLSKFGIKIK